MILQQTVKCQISQFRHTQQQQQQQQQQKEACWITIGNRANLYGVSPPNFFWSTSPLSNFR